MGADTDPATAVPSLASDPVAYMAHIVALADAGGYCIDCGENPDACICHPDEPDGAGDYHRAWCAAHPEVAR